MIPKLVQETINYYISFLHWKKMMATVCKQFRFYTKIHEIVVSDMLRGVRSPPIVYMHPTHIAYHRKKLIKNPHFTHLI